MDPYVIQQLFLARRDDLTREADESRLAQESHEESEPSARPSRRPARNRRLSFAR